MIARALLLRTLRTAPKPTTRTLRTLSRPRILPCLQVRSASHTSRLLSSQPSADAAIEEITELYATAKDEFEIAAEETEKVSVYAEEDRKAAREELERVKAKYDEVVHGADRGVAEEVKRRVGQRIRELEHGVVAMEEMAMNQD